MKRIPSLFLALLLSTVLVSAARAQEPVAALEWLTVDLWPDYDRPQVLVLLTGALPADAPRPASVSLPLPADATINAVARISAENQMIDDIEYSVEDGSLSLVTPDARFRVEYYVPYAGDGLQRNFSFRWQSPLRVGEMDLSVQQPRAATALTVDPEPDSVIEGSDQLQYHNLPIREVPPNDLYVVEAQYTMGSDTLTQAGSPAAGSPAAGSPAGGSPATGEEGGAQTGTGIELSWPVALAAAGLVLVLLALGWQLLVARSGAVGSTPRKPRPRRAERSGSVAADRQVRYCHYCGQRAQSGDRFCRECGTQLKHA
ncbi:MAG: zinc ribbon domain-containing protein [bacterium]